MNPNENNGPTPPPSSPEANQGQPQVVQPVQTAQQPVNPVPPQPVNPQVAQQQPMTQQQFTPEKRSIKKFVLLGVAAVISIVVLFFAVAVVGNLSSRGGAEAASDDFIAAIKSDNASDFDKAVIEYGEFASKVICDNKEAPDSQFDPCNIELDENISDAINKGVIAGAKQALQYDLLNSALQSGSAEKYNTDVGTNRFGDKTSKVYYSIDTDEGKKYLEFVVIETEDDEWMVFSVATYDSDPLI
jgi:hypothetical protein